MIKILFVCHGNICRSPMAELMMKKRVKDLGLEDDFYIASAATTTEEIWGERGNPVYPPAREKLAEHGISSSGKYATLLLRSDYDKYDYIIGMDNENKRGMLRICGGDPEGKISLLMDYTDRPRSVADPWYTRDFETTYRDIDEGLNGLLKFLNVI